MKKTIKNMAVSVRTRLLSLAKETKQENLLLLERFCLERLLYRLSQSKHKNRFVLKGAILFLAWQGTPHRITRDLDLLGFGDASIKSLTSAFAEICKVNVEDDGVEFDPNSVEGEEIRSVEEYVGVRLTIGAQIDTATLRLQVDVGFGDAYSLEPKEVGIPTILDFPEPILRAYSRETVIAEKFEAAVKLGLLNSRLKDYYDIWFLSQNFNFDADSLALAMKNTLARRATPLPSALPESLTEAFAKDRDKMRQWQAFWNKAVKTTPVPPLAEVVSAIETFLSRPLLGAIRGEALSLNWLPGGPWTQSK